MCIRDRFTSKQWIKGLDELGIIPKYTAIRNPQTNLAERVNRQLGNLFRIFVGDQHTKWSKFINTIECCINEVYHETIEVTPYEAHHGRKPSRVWEKFIKENCDTKEETVDSHQIFVRIKRKRERHAKRVNEANKMTRFQVGDLVLVRTHYQSDAMQRRIEKFCELYTGPFKIKDIVGDVFLKRVALTSHAATASRRRSAMHTVVYSDEIQLARPAVFVHSCIREVSWLDRHFESVSFLFEPSTRSSALG